MTDNHPEPVLRLALEIDRDRISDFAARWIIEYADAGECGLAYDTFIYEIENGTYTPSPEALTLIKNAAVIMNISFPNKSA